MSDLAWLPEFLDEHMPVWRDNPPVFFRQVLGFEPDGWQEEAAMDLVCRSKVAIKSGQGVGKTAFEAATFLWFLTCFNDARIVCTAPTKQQLNDVLWSEVAKWMAGSPLLDMLLRWTKTYVYVKGYEKRWFAVARTATKPENMQGFHEKNMLFIVDEASGVADPIMEAILGTLSGANNKLLMCGNPTRTSGVFYDAFHADCALYAFRTVSSRASRRTNKDNIQSLIRKYGEKSNVVRVRVDGEFPLQEDDVFIQLEWITGSIQTEMTDQTAKALGCYQDDAGRKIHDISGVKRIEIGCDVARFGDDKTCIGYRVNEVAKYYKKYHGKDTTATAGNISALYLDLKQRFRWTGRIPVKVDDGGVGGGTVDQLRAMKRAHPDTYDTMDIIPVNFGVPIRRHIYYYDTTTFMMSVLRDLIQPFDDQGTPKAPELILPDDADLIAQLSSRKYSFVSGGKQKVESKKEMKERGLPSPDEADCMLLVCLPVKNRNERR